MFGSKKNVREFEKYILRYESVPVEKGKILFYGDSLFTRCSWIYKSDNPLLEDEVRMKDGSQAIVNHGFGSSCADDLLYYYDRMVRPYEPRALALTIGGNDFAAGYSPFEVMELLGRVIDYAQADFPGIPVYIFGCGITQPRYRGIHDVFTRLRPQLGHLQKLYCDEKPNCHYLPLGEQGFLFETPEDVGNPEKIREDLFAEDKAHFNAKGYTLFFDYVREALSDLL